jgi:DNA ligase-1
MLLQDVADTSAKVAATTKRLAKIAHLVELLRRLQPPEIPIAVSYLSGDLRQGRIGIGWSSLRDARPDHAADTPSLTLIEVDAAFDRLAGISGAGSTRERARMLHELLSRATAVEQDFLGKLIFGELRQGALEGIMLDAIARAAQVPMPAVRRAHLLAGDLVAVATAALTSGEPGLSAFGVELFRPLQPMLADTAEDIDDALERLGQGAFEYKLDGMRVQVHKSGDDVRIYSRALNDMTASMPELVARVRALPARELILDGEVITLRENGLPQPFQVTARRFGRKVDLERIGQENPLLPFFFDAIYLEGETLLDQPGEARFAALQRAVPAPFVIPRKITSDLAEAQEFLRSARKAGHEGVVAKALQAPYDAGRRGSSWLKVKFTETLDLVVLASEWGHGRRSGWLSNLHLGARDPHNGGFVMLGKTFKGLTDAMLEWQTAEFLKREIGRDEWTVHVRPELVVEIAFDDIQASPRYPGGLALRFARVKRYRPDKRAEETDTIERVRQIYAQRNG